MMSECPGLVQVEDTPTEIVCPIILISCCDVADMRIVKAGKTDATIMIASAIETIRFFIIFYCPPHFVSWLMLLRTLALIALLSVHLNYDGCKSSAKALR